MKNQITPFRLKNVEDAQSCLNQSSRLVVDLNKSITKNNEVKYFFYQNKVFEVKTTMTTYKVLLEINLLDFSQPEGQEVVSSFSQEFGKRPNVMGRDSYFIFFLDVNNNVLLHLEYNRESNPKRQMNSNRPEVPNKVIDFFKVDLETVTLEDDTIYLFYRDKIEEFFPVEMKTVSERNVLKSVFQFLQTTIELRKHEQEWKANKECEVEKVEENTEILPTSFTVPARFFNNLDKKEREQWLPLTSLWYYKTGDTFKGKGGCRIGYCVINVSGCEQELYIVNPTDKENIVTITVYHPDGTRTVHDFNISNTLQLYPYFLLRDKKVVYVDSSIERDKGSDFSHVLLQDIDHPLISLVFAEIQVDPTGKTDDEIVNLMFKQISDYYNGNFSKDSKPEDQKDGYDVSYFKEILTPEEVVNTIKPTILEHGIFTPFSLQEKTNRFLCLNTLSPDLENDILAFIYNGKYYSYNVLNVEDGKYILDIVQRDMKKGINTFKDQITVEKYPKFNPHQIQRFVVFGLDDERVFVVEAKDPSKLTNVEVVNLLDISKITPELQGKSVNVILGQTATTTDLKENVCYYVKNHDLVELAKVHESFSYGFVKFFTMLPRFFRSSFCKERGASQEANNNKIKKENTMSTTRIELSQIVLDKEDLKKLVYMKDWVDLSRFSTTMETPYFVYWNDKKYKIAFKVERGIIDYSVSILDDNDNSIASYSGRTVRHPVRGKEESITVIFNKSNNKIFHVYGKRQEVLELIKDMTPIRTMYKDYMLITPDYTGVNEFLDKSDIENISPDTAYRISHTNFNKVSKFLSNKISQPVNFSYYMKLLVDRLAKCNGTKGLLYTKAPELEYLRNSNLKFIELLDLVDWEINPVLSTTFETYIYYKDKYYKLSVTPKIENAGSYSRENINSFSLEKLDPMDPTKSLGRVTVMPLPNKDPNQISLILFAPDTDVIYNYLVDRSEYDAKGARGILNQDLPDSMLTLKPVMANDGSGHFEFPNELDRNAVYLYINEHYIVHRLQSNLPVDLEQSDVRKKYFYNTIQILKKAGEYANFRTGEHSDTPVVQFGSRFCNVDLLKEEHNKALEEALMQLNDPAMKAAMIALKINLSRFTPSRDASYKELCDKLVDANEVIFELLRELRNIRVQNSNQQVELSTKISNLINRAMYKNV